MSEKLLCFYKCRWCGRTFSWKVRGTMYDHDSPYIVNELLVKRPFDYHQCDADKPDKLNRIGVADMVGVREERKDCPTKK